MAGRIRKYLKNFTIASLVAGALLSPFRGDFSPRISDVSNTNIPISSKYVIGHRAGSENYHENSLEAISDFGNTGADIAEIDVRKTKDGTFIVSHDPEIGGRKINDISYETAKGIAKREGYTLARLDEAIRIISREKKGVFVDLKTQGDEEKILSILKNYLPREKIFMTSESSDSLKKVKGIDKGIKTSLIMDGFPVYNDFIRRNTGIFPWREIKYSDVDYVSVRDDITANRFYKNASGQAIRVLPYNVLSGERVKELLKYDGVGGVIVDRPSEAVKQKKELLKQDLGFEKRSLEHIAGAAIFFFFISILFSYINITGKFIADIPVHVDILGVILFFVGLLYGYIYLKGKR